MKRPAPLRPVLILCSVFAVALVGVSLWSALARPPVSGGQPGKAYPGGENVAIDSPRQGEKISSPLEVTGRARRWYFEGSFPIELRDLSGALLGSVPATAQSDWMSDDFVPFKAVLVFSRPATSAGILTLKKDNPSGLAEFDEEYSVPVEFDLAGGN